MADLRKFGNTSNLVRFVLKNATTGVGLTGLSSASSGLIISTITDNEATATAYTVTGSTIESITTLGTFAAPTATKCRFREVDATNHKGLYEFQFADARFAVANSKRLVISVAGATNLLDSDYEIQLVQFDPYTTSMGLSLAKGTNVTGFNDIAATAIVSGGAITTSSGAVSSVTTTGTAAVVTTVNGLAAGVITAASIASNAITGAKVASDVAVASVTGDVGGKVLGGGAGTISGVGVNANVTQVNGVAASTFTGTAQAGASGTITLASDASSVANAYVDRTVTIDGGTGAGQSRLITAYNSSTKVTTVHRNWDTPPDNTSTYSIGATAVANLVEWLGVAPNALSSGKVDSTASVSLGATAPAGWIDASAFAQGAADKVWSTTSRILTAGTNIALAKGTGVTGFNDITAASVWGVARSGNQSSGTFGEYIDASVNSRLPTAGYTAPTTPPTAAAIATAILTTTDSGNFAVNGSPGKILVSQLGGAFTTQSSSVLSSPALANAPSGGGGGSTPEEIADAVWEEARADHTTSGTFGEVIDAKISSRSEPGTAQNINLTQDLTDVKTKTVGGALHGSWASAFGRMVLDKANKLLKLWGIGSQSDDSPLQTWDVDDANNPSTRTPVA